MRALTHNKRFFDAVSCLPFFGRICVVLFAFFLSACGMENAPLSQDQAMLVINMPHMKAGARAADGVAPAIPSEVTEIRFRVTETTGGAEAQERVFVSGTKLQFLLAPNRSYTVVGTAKAGQELLYEGSETVHTLAPGETRDVAISLLSKIRLALSVSSALQGPQSGPADPAAPIQILVGEGNATDVKVAIDGLVNKAVNWYVNDIPRGNAVLGTVSVDGLYTPPASVPANSVVRIKAVSAAAPSFAAEVTVNLIPEPGVDDPVPAPVTTVSPAGGT